MKRIISLVVLLSSICNGQFVNSNQQSASTFQLSAFSFQQKNLKIQNPNPYQSAVEGSEIQNFNSAYQYPTRLDRHKSKQAPSTLPQKKSAGLAILYSMILPGMGELYTNGYESGKYFTIAEAALWSVFTGYTLYGNWKRDNYITFAKSNAGINLDGMESNFIANVSIYVSIDDYNRTKELNREFDKTYNKNLFNWNWANNDKRKEFRDMWSSSENAYNKVRFVVGAIVLNRVVSAINAVRLVSAYNKNLSNELSWNVYFGVEDKPTLPSSITINFVKVL
ncbi:MAG: hypothetical protein FD143_1413 [Ignavibacteria bacterium]|nr:MAG: hypothetical protein FD143_1413 [Ignavibacteria bacterium]KAF0160566.1 MAG: hypothetical protein FD188_1637 [Ignavibacteria bacterium]